jgi:hypothetical protein
MHLSLSPSWPSPGVSGTAGHRAARVNQQTGHVERTQQTKPITLQQTTIQHTEPTSSPTELGEKILAFYAEPAADDSQNQG